MSFSVPRGRRTIRAVGAASVLALAAGCGSAPTLDAAAKTSLHTGVAEIRAASGNLAKAKAAVAKFRADVDKLVGAGDLDADDAKVLLAQVTQLEARITADAAPAQVAPSPTAAPVDAEPAPPKKDDTKGKPGKGKKDDKKKGARAHR